MKIKTLLVSLLLLVASHVSLSAQDKTALKRLKGFDDFAEQLLEDWSAAGMAVAIVHKGEVLLNKGYGYRDWENKSAVTPQTLFAIGSTTKAFTAAGLCILAEEKKIDLDKPVVTYLPSYRMYDEYAGMHITPRDLLCHRSGLPRHDYAWYGSDRDREELIEAIRYLQPSAGFREAWQYQNFMFLVAGYLAGKVSGSTWEEFTQKRILDPLGMKNTFFSMKEFQSSSDAALPYERGEGGKVEKLDYRTLDVMGPAGSIASCGNDMIQWLKFQLSGGKAGEQQLLSSPYFQQMHSPQMTMPGGLSDEFDFYNSYGLGWMISAYRGHVRVEHGGNIDGFSALVSLLPRDSIGIVVLCNQDGSPVPSLIRTHLYDRLLGEEIRDRNTEALKRVKEMEANKDEVFVSIEKDPKRKKGTSPSHALADYTGKFENKGYGQAKIEFKEDSLLLKFNKRDLVLQHYHYDVFAGSVEDGSVLKVMFEMDEEGEIEAFAAEIELGIDPIRFERVPEEVVLESSSLEKYVGEYEVAGTVIKAQILNGKLFLILAGQPDYEMIPRGKHNFDFSGLEGFSCTFVLPDGASQAQELILNQPNGTFSAKRKN